MKIIASIIGIFGALAASLGAYAFFNSDDGLIETKLENGLVLEIDSTTGYITGIDVTKEFIMNAFDLEENQVNLQVLDVIREEVGYGTEVYNNFRESDLLEVIEPEIETEGLSSTHALLVDAQNGRVLMNKREDEKMYPASMTKVMTALVAIEALEDLEELIQIDPDMFHELHVQNASMAGFTSGEWVPAIDLLYGIMVPSGGESTIAIARAVAGSEEEFVELMNQRAVELGMEQTQFMNPTGLHHPDHYSTAEDMVTLLKHALTNETFRSLFTTPTHTTVSGLTFGSTLFANLPRTEVTNGEILGGRTGFTLEAGRCLISLANINGREYILVTAGAENTPENRIQHLLDALYIYDQM